MPGVHIHHQELLHMKRAWFHVPAFVLVLAAAAAAGLAGQQASPASTPAALPASPFDPAIAARIDAYMQAQQKENAFSGTILLARHGEPQVQKAYGWANAEWEIPNTLDTKFRIGSITKQFTSMVVMQLQEGGTLKVQDPICAHLSPCPDAWKPVTIHHLLTHTSGIPSYTGLPDFRKLRVLARTPDEMIGSFRDLPLEFEPGARFVYNNSGYFLLGAIIEKVTGRKYEEELRDRIFAPLGMTNTGYDWSHTILPRRASGYTRGGSGIVNAGYVDMGQPYAAGALYSTVGDLLKWDQALYTDALLPAEARAAMFTPFKGDYAYGWGVQAPSPATGGHRVLAHGGGINGFSSMIIRLPDVNITAVVLSNLESANASRIARELLAIYFGQPFQAPAGRTVAKVDPALYDAYVGEYQLSPVFSLTVTRDGNRLFAQGTGQRPIEVFPESETTFFARAIDAQITFVKDAQGRVTHLVLHQNGRDQEARKVR
jgi:CubicO group peptidase (beta-lactamase class C family)